MESTRVLIVDDQVLFSELLQRTLASEPGVEVVGVAHDANSAIEMANGTTPDVVLLDIELPGEMDGIEAGIKIKQSRPQTGIVILSVHNDRRYVTSLPLDEHSGWSYLLKQSVPDVTTLVRAIQGSMKGMVVLDPAIINNLRPRQGSTLSGLTPRQRDVLELMAQGYSNAAVAERLILAEKTIETYISAIYQQLHLSRESDIHARVKATLLFLHESQNVV